MSTRVVTVLALLLGAAGDPAAAGEGAFDACERTVLTEPDDWKACQCFYRVATVEGLQDEATRRLEAHRRDRPDDPCLAFALGRLLVDSRDHAGAAALLRQAAEGYAARDEGAGEVYARVNLARALAGTGASGEELVVELDRARRVAEELADPVLRATVAVDEARLMMEHGGDAGEIEDSLLRARAEVFDEAGEALQRDLLSVLGWVRYARGRFAEAEDDFRRVAELTADAGDRFGEARARQNLAAAIGAQRPYTRRRETVEALVAAIEAAVAGGNPWVEVEARTELGRMLGGAEGHEQLELARARIESAAGDAPARLAGVLEASAIALLDDDPAEARRLVDRAVSLRTRDRAAWSQVYGWSDRLEVIWRAGSPEEALAAARDLRAIVDRLEEIQSTETARAEVSSVWTEIDQWIAGRLLLEAERATGAEQEARIEESFAASERMRARLLLESLTAGGVGPASAASAEDRPVWLETEREIVDVQRLLLDPTLPSAHRDVLLEELRRLEALEDVLAARRRQLRRASITAPAAPLSLAGLRAVLPPDEAVLAFQTAPWRAIDGSFDGGAWLLAITADAVRFRRLPDPGEIGVGVFLHTFERRDGSEAEPAAGLYEMLFGTLVDELPESVERLIVIPDGPLHRLPFAALRRTPESPSLAERFEIFVTPSATAWHRLRGAEAAGEATLALADPAAPGTGAGSATGEGNRGWTAGLVLRPLPYARREGRSALRHIGRPGRLLLGGDASEAAVKAAANGGLRLLHFGTHAVLDETYPQRSAVILAPGGADQDGWLRPREAAALDLGGAVVVLASCQSAQGALLRGEGALSLSRAFLEGGARAVVGSLWPLADDEAADVFDRFYRHLGRGETVARALALAQRDSLRAGDPAAAWAGLVVLGDGDAVVVTDPRPLLLPRLAALAAALVLAWVAIVVARHGRRGVGAVAAP